MNPYGHGNVARLAAEFIARRERPSIAGAAPIDNLEGLPQISEAFASGELGIDKVVELTRFATPQTEGRLITWAQGGVLRSDQA
ncbi:MAG TPA: hypothetical protein VEQ37_07980, partial [Actinomycetota bacterium]|nr:hypothetical protein [Actinomycetota bacterium]